MKSLIAVMATALALATTVPALRVSEGNEFADVTFEEFAQTHLMQPEQGERIRTEMHRVFAKETKRHISPLALGTGSAIDWRQHGAVTDIKRQGRCGSCWTFSAAANMEGQWFLYNGTLVSLSEQELVSCDKWFSEGCKGGSPQFADLFLKTEAKGYWTTDRAYPYVSGPDPKVVHKCNKSLIGKPAIAGARMGGWEFVHNYDEAKMAAWMYDHGPIGVCLDATKKWHTYTGGVLKNCGKVKPLGTNHCVLLVGFNNTEATPYWIVKNSWGKKWGMDGYMYLEKGKNMCNVAEVPYSGIAKKFFG